MGAPWVTNIFENYKKNFKMAQEELSGDQLRWFMKKTDI
jgi:hypothetical protein